MLAVDERAAKDGSMPKPALLLSVDASSARRAAGSGAATLCASGVLLLTATRGVVSTSGWY